MSPNKERSTYEFLITTAVAVYFLVCGGLYGCNLDNEISDMTSLFTHITKYLPDTECMQNSYQTTGKLSSVAMVTPHYTL